MGLNPAGIQTASRLTVFIIAYLELSDNMWNLLLARAEHFYFISAEESGSKGFTLRAREKR